MGMSSLPRADRRACTDGTHRVRVRVRVSTDGTHSSCLYNVLYSLFSTLLYSTLLYCTVLYCTALHCAPSPSMCYGGMAVQNPSSWKCSIRFKGSKESGPAQQRVRDDSLKPQISEVRRTGPTSTASTTPTEHKANNGVSTPAMRGAKRRPSGQSLKTMSSSTMVS